MQLLYVDSNVYIDYITNRSNINGVPLGLKAERFFYKVLTGDYKIIFSRLVQYQITKELGGFENVKMLLKMLESKLIFVDYTSEDLDKAKKLDSEETEDALHALLAKQYNAKWVVTRNIAHFNRFKHIVMPILPEDI